MKAIFTLRMRPEVRVPVPEGTCDIVIDGASVEWVVADDGCLDAVCLGLSGGKVRLNERGTIISDCPELADRAYAMAVYLGNRIFAQTGYDPVNPEAAFGGSPEVLPETEDEEALFSGRRRTLGIRLTGSHSVHGVFEPAGYAEGFVDFRAHGFYADAMRVRDPFQRVQMLFKVVEYYFDRSSRTSDEAVSGYASTFDPRFSVDVVRRLRTLRNRCTHPHAGGGPLGPHDRASARELGDGIPLLVALCQILLRHPPSYRAERGATE